MTRDTVWQDDPPFAVGEAAAKLASDEEISERMKRPHELSDFEQALVARIKFEREQTIRECIEKVKCMSGRLDDRLERKRVVGALEDLSNHSDMGIPISDPVRELRDNYKCGEEYEAGLWSRRNIEAFFRDQEGKS